MRNGLRTTLLAICALAVFPAGASAATFTVNDNSAPSDAGPGGTCGTETHSTITSALAAADALAGRDTIRVCAGNYAENPNVNSEVDLLGAQSGNDARTRSNPVSDEAVVSGSTSVTVDGTRIDGFTLRDGRPGPGGSGLNTNSGGNTYVNNIITRNNIGIAAISQPSGAETVIRHNRIADNNDAGPDLQNPAPAAGTGIYGDSSTNDLTIDENEFENHDNVAINLIGQNGGNRDITITDNDLGDAEARLENSQEVKISGNTRTGGDFHGIELAGGNDGVLIEDNTITGVGFSAIRLNDGGGLNTAPNTNVRILGNTLAGSSDHGIRVTNAEDEIDAHFNRIAGNSSSGISLDDNDTTIDAENNFFGCNSGPNTAGCDTIIGADAASVDVNPFLVLRLDADPNSTPVSGGTSQLRAFLTTNSNGETVGPGFPNGTTIQFATNRGTVNPLSDDTQAGEAFSTLTADSPPGTATVRATLDNATATDEVVFAGPPASPPPLLQGRCANVRNGTEGDDKLIGTRAGDKLNGFGGDDDLTGQGGEDCLDGGSGKDDLAGGAGDDRLVGASGKDELTGRSGEDRINAVDDQKDRIQCGKDKDKVKADKKDDVSSNCEVVRIK